MGGGRSQSESKDGITIFRRQAGAHLHSLHPLPFQGLLRDYWQRRRFLRLGKMLLREGGAWVKVLGKRVVGR